jgi:Zn-dependent metalloprotease
MPDEPTASNGLSAFSVHAFDDAASRVVDDLRSDSGDVGHYSLAGADPGAALDPETAARDYLNRALASAATPTFATPAVDGATSQFKTIGTETVPLTGTRTVKFRQTINDIPVYGSLVTVELDETNDLVGIDSAMGEPSGVDPVASVSPAQARAAVAAEPDGYVPVLDGVVPRLNYYFDSADRRWRLVYLLQDVPVRLDRKAEPASAGESRLEPPHYMDFVVDAHEGTVVRLLPRTPSMAAEEQTAVDSFGVRRTFLVSAAGAGFELHDPTHNVATFDFGFQDPDLGGDRLPGQAIGNPPAWAPAAVSAHANAITVSDFLRTVLQRNNIDGAGGLMSSSINCVVAGESPGQNQWANAFWNGTQMVYGQIMHPNGLRTLSANVDVVAHEMFHGVTDRTSRLEYAFQPGALNESYSDIFGTIVANLGNEDTATWDWLLGERLLPDDRPFRDLSDPARFKQPAHMRDFQALPNTRRGDWGGVHVNSGIHNKAAFNLLTARDADGVVALTPAEVAAVFYLALTQRLSRTSQFADSRRAAVASGRTLFRSLPAQERDRKVAAIGKAFADVGIQ